MESNRGSPSKVASLLQQWITNEMKYKTSGTRQPPISSLFLQKLCADDMLNVWTFLIHHVKSAENAQRVRQKIQHQRAKMETAKIEAKEERESLIEKRKNLTQKILEKKSNMRKLEQEIERLKKRVSTESSKSSSVQTQIKDDQLRDACLRNYERELVKMTEILGEYESRITKETKKIRGEETNNNNICNNSFIMSDDNNNPTNSIQEILSLVSNTNISSNNNTPSSATSSATQSIQSSIHQFIEKKAYTHKEIINSLSSNSRSHAEHISNSISTFTLGSSNTTNSDTQSQSQMLHKIRIEHANIFFETQKLLNKAVELETQCKNALAGLSINSTELQNLIALEISQIGLNGVKKCVQEYELVLVDIINKGKPHQQQLEENFLVLTQYEKQKHQKQEDISRFMELNLQQRRDIQRKVQEIQKFTHSRLVPLELTLRPLSTQLINYGGRDKDMFKKIPLQKLLTGYPTHSTHKHKSVSDFSIHRLASLDNVISSIDFPLYKGVDSLLPFILKLKQRHFEEQSNQNLENMLKTNAHQNSTLHNHSDFIDTIEHECQTTTSNFISQYTPLLNASIQHSQQGLETSKNVMKTAEEWWIQPAQHVLPWMKVENWNISNWIENWHKLILLSMINPTNENLNNNNDDDDNLDNNLFFLSK